MTPLPLPMTTPSPSPAPPTLIAISTADPQPPNSRRNGKIARLPKDTREFINLMLDDGATAQTIIDDLGEEGRCLNPQNISNWVQGGYQDYLQHQESIQHAKIQLEFAAEFLRDTGDADPTTVQRTGQLVASLQMLAELREHGEQMLQADSAKYFKLVNTLCSLSRATLPLQKRHDDQAAFDRTMAFMRSLPPEAFSNSFQRKLDELNASLHPTPARPRLAPPPPPIAQVNQASAGTLETEPPGTQPEIENPESKIQNPAQKPQESNQIKVNQASAPTPETASPGTQSEIKNPSELCLRCGSPLPPLLPSGERPDNWCACGSPLPPPGTSFPEHCPDCHVMVPIHGTNAMRHCSTCRHCGAVLPKLDPRSPTPWLPPGAPSATAPKTPQASCQGAVAGICSSHSDDADRAGADVG